MFTKAKALMRLRRFTQGSSKHVIRADFFISLFGFFFQILGRVDKNKKSSENDQSTQLSFSEYFLFKYLQNKQ